MTYFTLSPKPILVSFAAAALAFSVVLPVVDTDPSNGAYAASTPETSSVWMQAQKHTQNVTVSTIVVPQDVERDGYTIIAPPPPPPPKPKPVVVAPTNTSATKNSTGSTAAPVAAPVAAAANPGSAQAIAAQMVAARGWGTDQYSCLVSLWNRESGWRTNAANPSGAYGIPQALPGSKMASAGSDWATNPATQLTWGLNYISGVYGTPCAAWGHSNSSGWY
jgi:hypothetical protein